MIKMMSKWYDNDELHIHTLMGGGSYDQTEEIFYDQPQSILGCSCYP